MRKKNIYIGQVKECLNYDRYIQDGDESIQLIDQKSDVERRTFTESLCPNTRIVNNYALLIKQDDESFLWISKDGRRLLHTSPTKDEPFFVSDENPHKFYEQKSSKGFISRKRLVLEYKCDPRIPYGVEH